MSDASWTPVALWLAVIVSGLYHGLNPGMGWPLAASAGLMEKSTRAFFSGLGALAAGHLLAMLVVIAPFGFIAVIAGWHRPIQITASLMVTGFGLYQLIARRHARVLARIPPSRLALWSFAVAIAHGAGLMLLPVYLGLCRFSGSEAGDAAAGSLMSGNAAMALLVAVVHTAAMMSAGGVMAWIVYRYVGPKFIAQSWFNLDAVWAASLVIVGAISLAMSTLRSA